LTISQSQPETQKKKLRVDPFVDLRDGGSHATSTAPSQSSLSVIDELPRYKALRVPAASGSPLQYWKEQMTEYPILSHVAFSVYQPAPHSLNATFLLSARQSLM